MKKNEQKNENNIKDSKNVDTMSMFELMKMIDHNSKKIEGLSIKIDRLQNINAELKAQLKSKIESI